MRRFPQPITNLVAAFSRLPGVGPKTALRYVYYLLKQPKTDLAVMARTLIELGERIHICDRCYMYCEQTSCDICTDPKRDASLLCVVEESRDIATIEATQMFRGVYHVLGGTLNPIEGMTPDVIRLKELVERVQTDPRIQEIILALSPTIHGETTMMYIQKQLGRFQKHLSRLARGLPVGATLEFADEVTLGSAITGRRSI